MKTLKEYIEQKVHVLHPTDDDKYVHIVDVNNRNDFDDKWENTSHHVQAHFGWDSPHHRDTKTGLKKVSMKFNDYAHAVHVATKKK